MNKLITANLVEIIQQKFDCLTRLHQVCKRQDELIQANDMGNLLKLLAAKQSLIELLQHTEKQLEPFRAQNPEHRDWKTPADRKRCADQSASCDQLLKQIVELEKQCEQRLAKIRDEAAEKLCGANSASRARSAYTTTLDNSTGMLDLIADS